VLLPLSLPMYGGEFDHGGAATAVAAVEAVEDNLSAKAANNESIDGCMTACDDEIGRRTTLRQPTNKWRRGGGGGGSSGGGSARLAVLMLLQFCHLVEPD